jgi:hypothetical protein
VKAKDDKDDKDDQTTSTSTPSTRPAEKASPPYNWRVSIECVDCGAHFGVPAEGVVPAVERFPNGMRWALLKVPNECPECHNLKLLPRLTPHKP